MCVQLEMLSIGADDDRSEPIRSQYLCTSRGQRCHDQGTGMAVAVAETHRHQRNTWPHRVEELAAAARGASMMSNLQDVGVERVPISSKQPVLLRPFGVAHEQESHPPNADQNDGAREIRIVEASSPRRVRAE